MSDEPKEAPKVAEGLTIRQGALDRFANVSAKLAPSIPPPPAFDEWRAPTLPPGVIPSGRKRALDAAMSPAFSYLNELGYGLGYGASGFVGYPYLAQLMQIPEFRNLSEAPAGEMVKKWGRFQSASKKPDAAARIKVLERHFRRLKAREKFREAAVYDGSMGHGILYLDMGLDPNDPEQAKPLTETRAKLKGQRIRALRVIDPTVSSPNVYNSVNPLADDYYVPKQWYLLGKQVHTTRLLHFVGRPLPIYLKPAYNFGGMSMSQLAMDTVRNWREVRDSITRLIKAFSTSGLATDMKKILNGGSGEDERQRAAMFTDARDNMGVLMIDKATEEFFQFNIPLGALDKLQAQAQEHMAAPARIPLIILLGITPTGLNATAEPEIRAYYDYIAECQNITFRPNIEKLMRIIQLCEFGDVDEDITFEFEPLWQMDDAALARMRKDDSDAAASYVAMGAVSPKQVSQKLIADPASGYNAPDTGAQAESLLEPDPDETEADPDAAPTRKPAATAQSAAPAKPAQPARPAPKPKVR